jgi:hypothetical protein
MGHSCQHPQWCRALAIMLAALLACGAIFGALVLPPATPAAAAHYRSSQLSWVKVGGTTARFTSIIAHGRSWHGTPLKNVGDKINILMHTGTASQLLEHTVTFVDEANDWMLLEATLTFTYPGVGPYTAYIQDCCRLGSNNGHINNSDGNNRLETIVNLAATSASPVSTIPPIVDCPKDGLCSFTVPVSDPDGQEVRFRFATAQEADSASAAPDWFTQPGPPDAPNAATINPTTGRYTWDTTGAKLSSFGDQTYYSTQVVVENISRGQVISKVAVDFFIRIADPTKNRPPVFDCPTPADGTILNVGVGKPVTFAVAATDPDKGDTVRLGVFGKPADATLTATPGNPASGTFSWTPQGMGTTLLFLTAQDQDGLGATQRSVTINATTAEPTQTTHTLDLSTGPGGTASALPDKGAYREGECVSVKATPSGESVFTGWTVNGQPAGHANPLTITMDRDQAVVATFGTPPTFCDARSGDLYFEAIRQLAARKVIRGFEREDGALCFGPDQGTKRAQMAALIARPMGWDLESHGNGFTDRCFQGNPNDCIDDDLWRNVGTLARYKVVGGYKAETCAALALAPPCYGPHDNVLHAQVISFIARAMVEKGYWQYRPDNAALYPNVPADSGHRIDIATYVYYAGAIPGTSSTGQMWNPYDKEANRAWFAETLWRALDAHFGLDRTP